MVKPFCFPRRERGQGKLFLVLCAVLLVFGTFPLPAAGAAAAIIQPPTITVVPSPSQMPSAGPVELAVIVSNPAGNPGPLSIWIGQSGNALLTLQGINPGGSASGRFLVSITDEWLGKSQQLTYTYRVADVTEGGSTGFLVERANVTTNITLTRTFSAKVVGPGKTVSVHYEAVNAGSVPLYNVLIGDDYFGELAAGETLRPGETLSHDEETTIEGDLISTPYVKFTNPVTGVLETVKITPDVVRLEKAQLRVFAAVTPERVSRGEPVMITLTLSNEGNLDYKDLRVSGDTLPSLVSVPLLESTRTYVITRQLRPFETRDYRFVVEGKDSAGTPVSVVSEAVRVDVANPMEQQARWSIRASATPDRIQTRQQVTFTVELQNDGEEPLTDVRVECAQLPGWSEVIPVLVAAKSIQFATQVEKTGEYTFTASAARATGVGRYSTKTDAPVKVRVLSVLETPPPNVLPTAAAHPEASDNNMIAPYQSEMAVTFRRVAGVALWGVGGLIGLLALLYLASRVLRSPDGAK